MYTCLNIKLQYRKFDKLRILELIINESYSLKNTFLLKLLIKLTELEICYNEYKIHYKEILYLTAIDTYEI